MRGPCGAPLPVTLTDGGAMIPKRAKADYKVQSVDNALCVLEQFLDNPGEMSLTQLCRRLKFQKNKVFRLLATLEARNYLEQDLKTGDYRLGLKNLHISQNLISSMGIVRHARPVLQTVLQKCNETSYVSVMRNSQIIYLEAVESTLPVRVISRTGARIPFHCTGAGKILAAAMSDEKLRECLNGEPLLKRTPNTICNPQELRKHLREIAWRGYALDDEELETGVKCIAAQIKDYSKKVVGAVSISGPSMRMGKERINDELIPLLKEAAKEISSRLGYTSLRSKQ